MVANVRFTLQLVVTTVLFWRPARRLQIRSRTAKLHTNDTTIRPPCGSGDHWRKVGTPKRKGGSE